MDILKKGILASVLILAASTMFAERSTLSLDGEWTLDYWEQGKTAVVSPEGMAGIDYRTIKATVPGNVELDLYAAGLVDNPELGSNVYLLRQYEGYQWRYTRHFTTPAHNAEDDVFLHFGGIDCYAEIFLNGTHLGSVDNMLIEHEYDITGLIGAAGSDNTLEVYIRSSVIEGRKSIPGTLSYNFAQIESVNTRRAPHTYGWDIMPRLVSAGIWRSVSVEVKNPVHIMDAHWYTTAVDVPARNARLRLDYTVALPPRYQSVTTIDVTISKDGVVKVHEAGPLATYSGKVWLDMSDVEFWWPRGYGDPALYDATVKLFDKDGNLMDSDTKRIGIRTIELDMTNLNTVEKPGRFCFIVNGEKVYVHGSNWTPMDAFHSRDPQHLEAAFNIAKDLNCNMLRCWGGNVYEDHAFFDLCDENGIMVWQDFSMGCSWYPQNADFQKRIYEEVTSVVVKLRNHPSIALWAGNNEDDDNLTMGSQAAFRLDPNDDMVSRVTIPTALRETDPTRPYLPSSPYWSRESVENGRKMEDLPEQHLWGPRGYYKDGFYTGSRAIFVSEIGYHGMPCRESLERMFPKESVYPWTDVKEHVWNNDYLTKAVRIFQEEGYTPKRNNLMINQVTLLFGEVPDDLDDFIFASQSVQAEAMKYFIEMFRGRKFEPNTGMLWWNIRDGWPLISDAIVDFYNTPKMAYYFIRNAQKDVCVMMNDAKDGAYPLVVANDTREPASGKVTVKDVRSGRTVYKGSYEVEANGRSLVASIPEMQGQGILMISYEGRNGEKLQNHYLYGKAPFNLKEYKELLSRTGIYGTRKK